MSSVRRSSRLAASASKRRSYVDAAPLSRAEINAFVRPIKAAMDHFYTLKDVWDQYTQLLALSDLIMQFPDQSAYYPVFRAAAIETFWRNSTEAPVCMRTPLRTVLRRLKRFFGTLEELPTWRP
jgi:hypothetical protein